MYSYLLIDLLVFSTPFVVSRFLQRKWPWEKAMLSGFVSCFPLIVWDVYFTKMRVWGFNKIYLSGYYFFSLPLEEILFFVSIPFASLFIYENVKRYELKISEKNTNSLLVTIFALSIFLLLLKRPYSVVVGLSSMALTLYLAKVKSFTVKFLTAFLLTLFPFVIVNTILTNGVSWISSQPIVWYTPGQFSDLRFFSIPLEDFFYSFIMLFLNVKLYDKLSKNRLQDV